MSAALRIYAIHGGLRRDSQPPRVAGSVTTINDCRYLDPSQLSGELRYTEHIVSDGLGLFRQLEKVLYN